MDIEFIEEIILGMGEVVKENRWLRNEVSRLQEVERKHNDMIYQRVKESEQNSLTILRAACAGIDIGIKQKGLLK